MIKEFEHLEDGKDDDKDDKGADDSEELPEHDIGGEG